MACARVLGGTAASGLGGATHLLLALVGVRSCCHTNPCVCPCTSFGQEIISRHGQPQFVDRSSGLVLDVHPSDETFRAALREIRAAGPRVPDPDAEWMVFSDEFERSKGSHYWYNWL